MRNRVEQRVDRCGPRRQHRAPRRARSSPFARERAPARRSRAPSSMRTSPRPGTCGRRRDARSRAAAAQQCVRPSKRTSPRSGASSPWITLKHVVLPAPFGPMIATRLPGATVERDVARAHARRRTTSTSASTTSSGALIATCGGAAAAHADAAPPMPNGNTLTISRMTTPSRRASTRSRAPVRPAAT